MNEDPDDKKAKRLERLRSHKEQELRNFADQRLDKQLYALEGSIKNFIDVYLNPEHEFGIPAQFRKAHDYTQTYLVSGDNVSDYLSILQNGQNFFEHARLSAQAALHNAKEAHNAFRNSTLVIKPLPDLSKAENRITQVLQDMQDVLFDFEEIRNITDSFKHVTDSPQKQEAIAKLEAARDAAYGGRNNALGLRTQLHEIQQNQGKRPTHSGASIT